MQSEQAHLDYIHQEMEWIAVDSRDQPIAFINVERLKESLQICEVSVCQLCQGKGIGRQLIQSVLHYARERGIQIVTLTTFRHIVWNAPYYQRLGFSLIKQHELTIELKKILQQEVIAGFKPEERCAMRISSQAKLSKM